ncbi:hypothetical protein [Mesomycoplasma ovipneumoniae]|uniref:hypothetical protein n=2 Tax=Mesomycoplasma ovipneumoniae TaxID=29562 RepID=UPI003080B8E4
MAGFENEVLVLFKGAFNSRSKDWKIRSKFEALYRNKEFLEYISRLDACIAEENNYLVKNFWETAEDKSPKAYASYLKSILEKQEKDLKNGVELQKNLLQILPDGDSEIIPVELAKKNTRVSKEQTVWSYVISFKDIELIHKNKISSLEEHGKYLSPEINKWLRLNNLKIKDLNIFAGVHYNTNHPHIHLWISEKRKTIKFDGKLRFDKREKFKYAKNLAEGVLAALSPKQNLEDLYDLVNDLREIKKETKKAIEEFDLRDLSLDPKLQKSIIEYSNVYSEKISSSSKNSIENAKNLPELFDSIKKLSEEKNFPSLSLDILEKNKILNSNSQKRSKFFKYLDESKKETINLLFKKILDTDLRTKNLIYRFNQTINKISEYQKKQDFEVISYAKNIIDKEQKEFFYQNRNVVLKKLNKELDFAEINRKNNKDKKTSLQKINNQSAFFSYYQEDKPKKEINLVYWYKRTVKKITG